MTFPIIIADERDHNACLHQYDGNGCLCGEGCCDGRNKQCKDCFSSAAKVNLENGKSVAMSELQEGDKVQTGKKS